MLYDLMNPWDVEKFDARVSALKERMAKVELVEKKPQRSLSQNAYLHTILGYFAEETGYTLEEVKIDYYKRLCNKDIFVCKRTNKYGKEVEYVRSSSSLDTREMSLSIDRFRAWSVANGGPYLPAPHESEMLFYCEQQIQKYAEYV